MADSLSLVSAAADSAATAEASAPTGEAAARQGFTYYAVLIGIDNYLAVPKLSGCVSDIETIEELLGARIQGPLVVRKLVARREEEGGAGADDELPTRDAIIAVLSALSGDAVNAGDRVLFYYSGHGTQLYDPAAEDTRQALVPQDFQAGAGLLYDIELRTLLDRIYARTGDLTVVLDCCHSGGITRDDSDADAAMVRCIELRAVDAAALDGPAPALLAAPAAETKEPAPIFQGQGQGESEYPFLLACQADEKAKEQSFTEPPQGTHGVLTHALVRTLSREPAERLATLCWADIWWPLQAEIIAKSPQQHPHLLGSREQRILGGASPKRTAGLPLRLLPEGRYEIGIGTLAGLRAGARIAVYAAAPKELPPLGSAAERELVRAAELIVIDAALATATAIPEPPSAVVPIPTGACARVTQPAAGDLLTASLLPELPEDMAQALRAAAADDRVRYVATGAEARIGIGADGGLWLGDDVYGPGPPTDSRAPGPLAYVPPVPDRQLQLAALRAALRHYGSYVIPLRMSRQGGFTIEPGRIQLQLLECADAEALRVLREDASRRRPIAKNQRGIAQLAPGSTFALALSNRLSTPLYVTLISCAASGKVGFLARGEFLAGKCTTVIGRSNAMGQYGPISARIPGGHSWIIDRIIAVATSQPSLELYTLRQDRSFAEIIAQALREGISQRKDFDDTSVLEWTAACFPVQIGESASSR